jgi:hypothetical protein
MGTRLDAMRAATRRPSTTDTPPPERRAVTAAPPDAEPLYQRCSLCSGSLRVVAATNTDPVEKDRPCPCTTSPTPGWAAIGLTVGQVERLVEDARKKPGPGGAVTEPAAAAKVVFKCQHTRPAGYFAGRDCNECVHANRVKRGARKRAAQQAAAGDAGRLPDGATFALSYFAGRREWVGELRIPQPNGDPLLFHGTASGLFRLEIELDRKYRESLQPPIAPPPEATA